MLTIAILFSSSKHVNRPLCLHKQLARPVKPGCQNMHNPAWRFSSTLVTCIDSHLSPHASGGARRVETWRYWLTSSAFTFWKCMSYTSWAAMLVLDTNQPYIATFNELLLASRTTHMLHAIICRRQCYLLPTRDQLTR